MFEDLRVGPQWILTRNDIHAIASDYDLTVNPERAQSMSGAVNGVVRVATSTGDIVLRVHRPWTTPERLTTLHTLFHTLRLAALPILRLLQDRTGATWTRLADRLVEVAEYVPSDYSADTWASSTPAFATLAHLHAALADVPPGTIPPPAYSSYATPETELAMLAETEEQFNTHTNHPECQQAAATRQATRALLRTLAVERTRYEPHLSRSLVHGDYGGGNVLLRGGQVVTILDFTSSPSANAFSTSPTASTGRSITFARRTAMPYHPTTALRTLLHSSGATSNTPPSPSPRTSLPPFPTKWRVSPSITWLRQPILSSRTPLAVQSDKLFALPATYHSPKPLLPTRRGLASCSPWGWNEPVTRN